MCSSLVNISSVWLRELLICLSADLVNRQVPADAPGDPRGGVLDGIPSKVSIPRGRLNPRVAQQLPDHREALAQGQRPRSIRMTKVMDSHVLQPGARAGAASATLEIGCGRPAACRG